MSLVRSLAMLVLLVIAAFAFMVYLLSSDVGHDRAWSGLLPPGLELPLSSDPAGIGVAAKRLSTGSRSRNADAGGYGRHSRAGYSCPR